MSGPNFSASEDGPKKVTAADGHTYHKSATANAPVAPTNEHTITNATKQGKMTQEELDFVTTIHYEYGLHGHLPTKEYLFDEYGYTEADVRAYYNHPLIIAALDERGIILNAKQLEPVGIDDLVDAHRASKHTPKLTPLQLIVANAMLDLSDTRTERKKLQDLGVTTSKFNTWLKNPDFHGYLRDKTEAMLGENHHEALLSLIDNVRKGDNNAIKLYFAMTGRYVEQTSSGTGASTHDLQNIIVRIIEIILEEVDDQQTALRISDRLKGLVAGATIAGIIEPQAIVDPGVATLEISDQRAALMAKGIGVNS